MAETFGSTCHGAGRAASRNSSRHTLDYTQACAPSWLTAHFYTHRLTGICTPGPHACHATGSGILYLWLRYGVSWIHCRSVEQWVAVQSLLRVWRARGLGLRAGA